MNNTKRAFNFVGSGFVNILIMAFSLFCLFPVFWMISSSIKEESDFLMNVAGLPRSINLQNYVHALTAGSLDRAFVNSAIVSVVAVALGLFLCFITGIVFARYKFKGKNILFIMFISGMLIPVHSLLIPLFIQLRTFNMLNNHFALALIYAVFSLPRGIFLVTAFASTIPKEIEEAVIIDGGSTHQLFFRIFLPMCKPVIGTLTILNFLDAWNEFPFALVFMGRAELQTLPIALTHFTGQFTVQFTLMIAGLTIATLPVVAVYLIFHKQIMQGMVAGSVKG